MQSEYFKKTIQFGIENKKQVWKKAEEFYHGIGLGAGRDLMNPAQIVRSFLKKINCYVVELPLKDKKIEAVCYKGDYAGYVVLNTASPMGSVTFALCHMLSHLIDWREEHGLHADLYIRDQCCEEAKELEADLFSRMLLMPEQSFTVMFQKFRQENADILEVLAELMNYYKVPYFPVLIRCYELHLLEAGEVLYKLLQTEEERIKCVSVDYWSEGIHLEVTHRDEYAAFRRYVAYMGSFYEKQQILNNRTINKALSNMDAMYHNIRGIS